MLVKGCQLAPFGTLWHPSGKSLVFSDTRNTYTTGNRDERGRESAEVSVGRAGCDRARRARGCVRPLRRVWRLQLRTANLSTDAHFPAARRPARSETSR